jgi:hypothetical protein
MEGQPVLRFASGAARAERYSLERLSYSRGSVRVGSRQRVGHRPHRTGAGTVSITENCLSFN